MFIQPSGKTRRFATPDHSDNNGGVVQRTYAKLDAIHSITFEGPVTNEIIDLVVDEGTSAANAGRYVLLTLPSPTSNPVYSSSYYAVTNPVLVTQSWAEWNAATGIAVYNDSTAQLLYVKLDASLYKLQIAGYTISDSPPPPNQSPIAIVSSDRIFGTAPLTVSFSSLGSLDPDGSIVSHVWAFGDGATSTNANPVHTYASAGTFVPVLVVTDNLGLMTTATSATITVSVPLPPNQPPVATIGSNVTSGLAPLAVAFSSSGSSDPDGSIASYAWVFGDGNTSTQANPSHTYASAGVYSATLTVTDNSGLSTTSTTLTITATNPPPPPVLVTIDVSAYQLTRSNGNNPNAVATVTVRNQAGLAVSGARVTIRWSGLVTGDSTGITTTSGAVTLMSGKTKKAGTITGTIISITPPSGATYDASIYSEPTVRSIVLN